MQYQPPTGSIPDAPGSYQFYDAEGRVLYVGKAKSLRHRLPNYWQDSANLLPRTAQMVAQADHVEWVVVENEVDTLILEHSLIQAHLPRYNVRLKDDKSYPWLAVTLDDEWPRPAVIRGRKRKGVRYFGPYGHAGAIRDHARPPRPELPGPHVLGQQVRPPPAARPPVPALRHRAVLGAVRRGGRPRRLRRLRRGPHGLPLRGHRAGAGAPGAEMQRRRTHLEFERAARLRDRIAVARKAAESPADGVRAGPRTST